MRRDWRYWRKISVPLHRRDCRVSGILPIIKEANDHFVIMDTAPTGHTLLLLDATGAYHREMVRQMGHAHDHVITPMMQLQDPEKTRVIIVTLAETTPVLEAAGLQQDLRRAGIDPGRGSSITASRPRSRPPVPGHPCPSRTAADRRRCRALCTAHCPDATAEGRPGRRGPAG